MRALACEWAGGGAVQCGGTGSTEERAGRVLHSFPFLADGTRADIGLLAGSALALFAAT